MKGFVAVGIIVILVLLARQEPSARADPSADILATYYAQSTVLKATELAGPDVWATFAASLPTRTPTNTPLSRVAMPIVIR